ncbi:MAG: competence damage-inducible protein A [Thermoprotei archaeon]|nr:nicotinamide mononucleotide deamidase-related protein [Thermoproteales archaeon]RLE88967.1 MAG: competence damage-inducible protein A [Thermoprotei archaeon]RLE96634.1 MAG: competence damage-inducible protein A [Thermoprotei archaeon]
MGLAPGPEAWLISVGNELLIGRVVNTNMAWLGRRLTLLGYRVGAGLVVPDEVEAIAWAFRTAVDRGAKVIVSTGGLGPTFDDKTSEGLAVAMGVELALNEEALKMIEEKYSGALTESRVKMARMPRGARPIPNPVGTAPGVEVEWRGALIFLLPGVPAEMEAMFERHVEPKLRSLGPRPHCAEALLRVRGVPESLLAPVVEEAMKLSALAYIKSHPRGSELGQHVVDLHITAYGSTAQSAEEEVERIASYLARELQRRGAQVSRASCAGEMP